MATEFKAGDEVLSDNKWCIGLKGSVWKVSDYGVHCKFIKKDGLEFFFIVFHFDPTHHKQSPISELKLTGESLNTR